MKIENKRIKIRILRILKINNDSQAEEKRLTNFANILINVCIAILIGAIIMFGIHQYYDSSSAFDTGLLGNMGSFLSGTIGVIFTFVSVILFYTTLRMQREELKLQRDELKLQRDEMAKNTEELSGQKQQLEAQNKTMTKQSFENTFFQLLNVHSNIVNAMELRKSTNLKEIIAKGRDCFKLYWDTEEHSKLLTSLQTDHKLGYSIKEGICNIHVEDSNIRNYFCNLYHIIKFVENSDIEDKKTYINFIRAQLSNYELVFLFFNGLSDYGKARFKPLIEKYSLLKSIDKKCIIEKKYIDEYMDEYDKKAYGNEEK
ncbi:MAG: hypothetical protein A2X02_05400 [Bacteroidetes bacterium GWF2_29_10]|nr:MAG: hypothetical protein A2X02_05400 [Bacteroidetes bacterium GWF2_29_10]